MTGRALLLASAFVAALVALATEKAGAASWLEKNLYLSGPQYEGKLPPCDYRDALTLIASRFNQKENMYWVTDLRIVNFERIRETAFRPWAANAIPRRFCSGVVEVTDGRKHAMAKDVKFGRKPRLSVFQRQEAIRRRAEGETLAEIAKSYAVDISMISRLR